MFLITFLLQTLMQCCVFFPFNQSVDNGVVIKYKQKSQMISFTKNLCAEQSLEQTKKNQNTANPRFVFQILNLKKERKKQIQYKSTIDRHSVNHKNQKKYPTLSAGIKIAKLGLSHLFSVHSMACQKSQIQHYVHNFFVS